MVETRLFERDEVVRAVDLRLCAADRRAGGLLVVTGPTGIGRSALARTVAGSAHAKGFTVWEAQGHRFEEDEPYGVVRQLLDAADAGSATGLFDAAFASLFEGVIETTALGEPTAPTSIIDHCDSAPQRQAAGAFHELYRAAVATSARQPLAVIVDDAHWADAQSLRWLHYLARRANRLRILIVVFARCDDETSAEPMMAALRALDPSGVITLEPLGTASVSALLADALGAGQDAAAGGELARLAAACLHSTGGNPFLLRELVGQIRTGAGASAPPAGPIGFLVSPAVSDAVLARLHTLGPDAVKVARAVVVLGESGRLDQVAVLAGVDRTSAAAHCDLLRRCGVLEPAGRLRFVHPLVAAAVQRQIPAAGRSLMHTRAARLLAASDAPVARVAGQLLQALPSGDRWVVRSLLRAARRALDAGVPEIAVHYLARAARELPAARVQARVRLEWGVAAAMIDPRYAVPQYELAGRFAMTMQGRSAAALGLAGALARCDRPADADRVLAEAATEAHGSATAARLRAERLLWGCWWRDAPAPAERAARLAELDAAPDHGGDRHIRVLLPALRAWESTIAGAPDDAALDAVLETALADGTGSCWVEESSGAALGCLVAQTLVCAGRFEQACTLLNDGLATLGRHGQRGENRRLVLSLRALAELRLGALALAELDARAAWNEVAEVERGAELGSWWWSASVLAAVLIARGDLDGAQALVTRADLGGRARAGLVLPDPLAVRGRLRLLQGRFAEAADDLRAAGRGLDARGCVNPSCDPWQTDLALALRAHAPAEAMAVADQALRRARAAGTPWAIGRALRTVGLLTPGTDGLGTLEESARALGPGIADLEYASSLIEWGAALRRANRREAAREPLREALQVADRCGAAGLVGRARQEIAATGARPRRIRLTGLDALTPSEARVAALAVDGLGNVQIARTLLVTRKTVEKHLANVYLKLEISSRRELGAVLAPGAARD